MNFYFAILFSLFFLLNCSHTKETKGYYSNISIVSSNVKDMQTIKNDLGRLVDQDLTNYLNIIVNSTKIIDICEKNCALDQVACVFPNKKKIIYLTPSYFELSWHEKIGTLLHEIQHHKQDSYTHVDCSSTLISNNSCDQDFTGPFGQELIFYNNLIKHKTLKREVDQLQLSIRNARIRINQ